MLLLDLPRAEGACSLRALVASKSERLEFPDLECGVCGAKKQIGSTYEELHGDAPESVVLKVNRYRYDGTKRHDAVTPDPELILWNTTFYLCAVLEHHGDHYISWVRICFQMFFVELVDNNLFGNRLNAF